MPVRVGQEIQTLLWQANGPLDRGSGYFSSISPSGDQLTHGNSVYLP